MFDGRWRQSFEAGLKPVGANIRRTGITADHLTATGVVMAAAASVAIANGALRAGLLLLVLCALPDLLDGAVAKASGTAGPRGAFFDSVSDRVTDALLLGGVAWYLATTHPGRIAVLPMAVLAASMLISYERAKAESLGFDARGGLMERAERIILLGVGLLFDSILIGVLWVMLVLTLVTAGQRFVKVWQQASVARPTPRRPAAGRPGGPPAPPSGPGAASSAPAAASGVGAPPDRRGRPRHARVQDRPPHVARALPAPGRRDRRPRARPRWPATSPASGGRRSSATCAASTPRCRGLAPAAARRRDLRELRPLLRGVVPAARHQRGGPRRRVPGRRLAPARRRPRRGATARSWPCPTSAAGSGRASGSRRCSTARSPPWSSASTRPALFEWFVELRRSFGFEVVALGPDAGPATARALKANHTLALLCDRDLAGTGPEVEFFGERTTLPGGPATLALRTGRAAPPHRRLLRRPRHCAAASCCPPLDTTRHGKLRDDVQRVTQDLAHALEDLIRRAPEQWHLLQPNWPSDRSLTDRPAVTAARSGGPPLASGGAHRGGLSRTRSPSPAGCRGRCSGWPGRCATLGHEVRVLAPVRRAAARRRGHPARAQRADRRQRLGRPARPGPVGPAPHDPGAARRGLRGRPPARADRARARA